jgi:alpha,alpha-trehalose phosphorylase
VDLAGGQPGANQFRIDGVTGPYEYSATVDNNVYTNLMAQRNLTAAAEACARHADDAAQLSVTGREMSAWHAAAAAMMIPFHSELGVHRAGA